MVSASDLVRLYGLSPHPEGGFHKETYRAAGTIPAEALPKGFHGPRNFSTGIFYLLPAGTKSKLHRLASDETFHFYLGGPLILVKISPAGELSLVRMGQDVAGGCQLQHIIAAGTWFGAYPEDGSPYCLIGCTVAPGYDFADVELGDRAGLLRQFPKAAAVIERLMA